MPVQYRHADAPGGDAPLPVDWGQATNMAVVVLVDSTLACDPPWVRYVQNIVREATSRNDSARVFPVVTEAGGLDVCQGIQALRWDDWAGSGSEREGRLIRDLTHEFVRMLRHRPEAGHPDATGKAADNTEGVRVFLSHSTKDPHGKRIAEDIRDWLHRHSVMSSFLAPRDIPAGMSFGTVISGSIQDSAVVVIHTDSYSSREWCRREVIEAKRANVPMLVVDCLELVDERSFPYLGNVPVVRMDPAARDTIPVVVGRLLDEVFQHILWRRGVECLCESPRATFMAKPPELLSIAALPDARGEERLVVYPDPPLGTEELDLFSDVGHNLRLLSLNQWQVEVET
ncbi:MAG: toll/interleukin-1 receptor domain-containing protein [Nitrosopumilaceae archaeon]|nr:toll/interleukin-1 receptor domain-containing protein [Nitrosopumilaceae archaeon]